MDNILVTYNPDKSVTLKVCDFGVSGTIEDFSEIPRGKMRNYPPEAMGPKNMHECYEQTPASDLYMLGLVMWEMLNVKLVWNQYPTNTAN